MLSLQELVDCCELSPEKPDKKCYYTYSINRTFKWIMDSGISTEEDYPFQEQKWDYCKPKTKVYIFLGIFLYLCLCSLFVVLKVLRELVMVIKLLFVSKLHFIL